MCQGTAPDDSSIAPIDRTDMIKEPRMNGNPTVPAPPVLRVQGVSKGFPGVQALSNVRIEVARGEVHALVGENGAGKSTLMKILYGVHQPDSGTIELNGQPVTISNPHQAQRLGISMVHQELNLVPA